MEDNFSVDLREWGVGEENAGMKEGRAQAATPTAHLLLCGLFPNPPLTGTGSQSGDWGL